MDWKTFAVQMTQALAWPIVIITVLILFWRALKQIPERLLSVKFRDFEFAFADQAGRVAQSISSTPNGERPNLTGSDDLEELAKISPRAAILEAWLQVESSLQKIALIHGLDAKVPFGKLLRELNAKQVINEKTVASITGLMTLRNLAVHAYDAELTTQKAIDFLMLARAVLFILSTV